MYLSIMIMSLLYHYPRLVYRVTYLTNVLTHLYIPLYENNFPRLTAALLLNGAGTIESEMSNSRRSHR